MSEIVLQKITLHLLDLTCVLSEENDGDELFLTVNDKKVWPESGKYQYCPPGTIKLDVKLPVSDRDPLEIELWEYDTFSKNDHLGTFSIANVGKDQSGSSQLRRNDSSFARYTLDWKIES